MRSAQFKLAYSGNRASVGSANILKTPFLTLALAAANRADAAVAGGGRASVGIPAGFPLFPGLSADACRSTFGVKSPSPRRPFVSALANIVHLFF